MKKLKRLTAFLLALALLCAYCPLNSKFDVQAASKAALSSKKLTLKAGAKATLKLKNSKSKVKWSVVSGKKCIKLTNKKKTSVKIKAVRTGNAKVQAKAGGKKYVCRVTVRSVESKTESTATSTQADGTKATSGNTVTSTPTSGTGTSTQSAATTEKVPDTDKKVKLSGYLKSKNGTILKELRSLELRDSSDDEDGYTVYEASVDEESGQYNIQLTTGQYTVCSINGERVSKSLFTESVSVGQQDMEYDFVANAYCAMGKIVWGGQQPVVGEFEIYQENSSTAEYFSTNKEGEFCLFIQDNNESEMKYIVEYKHLLDNLSKYSDEWLKIGELDFAQSDLIDITLQCNYYQISGIVTNHGKNFTYSDYVLEEENEWGEVELEYADARLVQCVDNEWGNPDGDYALSLNYNLQLGQLEYIALVKPGKYSMKLDHGEAQTSIDVTNTDMESANVAFDIYPISISLKKGSDSIYNLYYEDGESDASIMVEYRSDNSDTTVITNYSENKNYLVNIGKYYVEAEVYTGTDSEDSYYKQVGSFNVPDVTGDVVIEY